MVPFSGEWKVQHAWKDIPLKEVCCIPGVKIKEVTRKFPSLAQCSDYYPQLILDESGDKITTCSQSKGYHRLQSLGTIGEGIRSTGYFFLHYSTCRQ